MIPFFGGNFQDANVPRNRRYSQEVIEPLREESHDVVHFLSNLPTIKSQQMYPVTCQLENDRILLKVKVPQAKKNEHVRVYEIYGIQRSKEYKARAFFKAQLDGIRMIKDIGVAYVGLGSKNFVANKTGEILKSRLWDSNTLKLAVHSLREEFATFASAYPKSTRSFHVKLLLEMFRKFYHEVENEINGTVSFVDQGRSKTLVKFTIGSDQLAHALGDSPLEETFQADARLIFLYRTPATFGGCLIGNDMKHFNHDKHHIDRRDSLCNCTDYMHQLEHLRTHSHFHSLEHASNEPTAIQPFKMRKYQCPTMTDEVEQENDAKVVLPNLHRNSISNKSPGNGVPGTGGPMNGITRTSQGPGLPVSVGKEGQTEMVLPTLFETIRFHVLNGNLTAIVNPHMEETQQEIALFNRERVHRRESVALLHERTSMLDGRIEQAKRFKPALFWTADGEHHYHDLNPIKGANRENNVHRFHNFTVDSNFAMASVAGILAEKSQISLKGLVKKEIPNSNLKNTRSIKKVVTADEKMPNERILPNGERRCSIQQEPRLYGKGLSPGNMPESGDHIKSKLWSDLRVGPGSMNRNRIKEQGVKTVHKLMAISQAATVDTSKKLANISNIVNKFAVYKKIAFLL